MELKMNEHHLSLQYRYELRWTSHFMPCLTIQSTRSYMAISWNTSNKLLGSILEYPYLLGYELTGNNTETGGEGEGVQPNNMKDCMGQNQYGVDSKAG